MSESILIFGDICPDNDYRKFFDRNENGAFSDAIVKTIASAGLVIANFECPATENSVPITKCGPSLRAKLQDIEILKNTGFDVLSLANNHILDFGIQGVTDTISQCKKVGIDTVGAGINKEDAARPIVCTLGNKKVGIVSFAEAEFNLAGDTTPGAHHFDPYDSFEQVSGLKNDCDYVIVLYHGGIEHYKNPSPLLQKKCRKFVSSGADLILCQHSHCIGTMENYETGTIVYGQGNSLFGYRAGNDAWNEGLIIEVNLSEENSVKYKLMKATEKGIELAEKPECKKRVHQMKVDSEKLSDSDWIKREWINYANKQASLNLPLVYGWGRIFNKLNRVLRNKLILQRYSRRKLMITMNLLRCEAHHEVVQTILEDRVFSCK